MARLMLLMQTSRLISNLKSENEALKDELERMRQGNAANAMPDSTVAQASANAASQSPWLQHRLRMRTRARMHAHTLTCSARAAKSAGAPVKSIYHELRDALRENLNEVCGMSRAAVWSHTFIHSAEFVDFAVCSACLPARLF